MGPNDAGRCAAYHGCMSLTPPPRHRLRLLRLPAALAAVCLLVPAILSGCGTRSASGQDASALERTPSAPASPDATGTSTPRPGPLVDPKLKVGEWRHAWQVVGLLRARPPRDPVVLYLGDSTARESVVSDAAWTRALRHRGAPVRAFTLASHDQTFRTDRRFIEALPPLRGLALIGVSLSRFVGPPLRGPFGRPAAFKPGHRPRLSHWDRHYYDTRPAKSSAAKAARVVHWELSRTGKFRRYRAANLRALATLIAACRERGLRPVLVQLPQNEAVLGRRLDTEQAALSRGCRRVATKLHVRFLDFQLAPDLTSADFFDICHLVRPGAAKWQRALSDWTVRLLPGAGG
jgi:hypothetical protein